MHRGSGARLQGNEDAGSGSRHPNDEQVALTMPTDINSFHNVFDQAVSTGFANIQSDVSWLFNIMIALTIALTALLTWIWGDWDGLIRSLIQRLSLIHISEPTRQAEISYAVFCLKKK